MLAGIHTLEVRAKSALSTSWVSEFASAYEDTVTEDTNQDFSTSGGGADRERMARKFTATATRRLKSVSYVLGRTGSPAGSVAMQLYTDHNGLPGYPVGGKSDSVLATALSAAAGGAVQAFTWSSNPPEVVLNTKYLPVIIPSGYTYANGVTEIRWRTDTNGAVGLDECVKFDDPVWSSIGTDVGAALTVNYDDVVIPLGSAESLRLLVDFTKGSSGGMRLKVEVSEDNSSWYQLQNAVVSGNVVTLGEDLEFMIAETAKKEIEIGHVLAKYARVSVKALTNATNAQCGVIAQFR